MAIGTWSGCLGWAAIGVGTLAAVPGGPAEAQTRSAPATAAPSSRVIEALRWTEQTGRPTVVGVTSATVPESQRLWRSLTGLNTVRELSESVQFVELDRESDPATARLLKVQTAPTILVYGREDGRVRLLSHRTGPQDPYAVLTWLGSLGLPSAARPDYDPAVSRAGFAHHAAHPSPQQPVSAPPLVAAPPAPQAPPLMMAPAQVAPVYTAQPTAPVVVSPPSTPVVVQPSAPTVVVGPTPAPNIVFAPSAPSAPSITMLSAPAAPASGVMLAPQPAAPVAPMAMAPVAPMAPLAVAPMAPMAAAPPASAPQSAVGTAVVGLLLENPSLIRRLIGALGRLLARCGNPTVQMTTMPQTAQIPLAAPVYAAPAAPAYAAPAAPAPMYAAPAAAAPQPMYYVPSAPQPPAAAQPSPQGGPSRHGWLR